MTVIEAQLRSYARGSWPEYDWDSAELRVGAFHTVLIPPTGPVLRVATGSDFASRGEREAGVLRSIARVALPIPAPHVLAGPSVGHGWSATLISRVPGVPADDVTTTDRAQNRSYAELLRALRAVDPRQVSLSGAADLVRRQGLAGHRPTQPATTPGTSCSPNCGRSGRSSRGDRGGRQRRGLPR